MSGYSSRIDSISCTEIYEIRSSFSKGMSDNTIGSIGLC